jgi:hypothetical protein
MRLGSGFAGLEAERRRPHARGPVFISGVYRSESQRRIDGAKDEVGERVEHGTDDLFDFLERMHF